MILIKNKINGSTSGLPVLTLTRSVGIDLLLNLVVRVSRQPSEDGFQMLHHLKAYMVNWIQLSCPSWTGLIWKYWCVLTVLSRDELLIKFKPTSRCIERDLQIAEAALLTGDQ